MGAADFNLRSRDVINSNLGTLWVQLPNGRWRKMGEVRNIQARIDVATEEFRCIGEMMHRHKGVGMRGSGSMNLYTGTPEFLHYLDDFKKDFINYRFTIHCTNRDPETVDGEGRGSQIIVITDVLLHGAELFKLDTEDGLLDQDVDFDFDDYQILQEYNFPLTSDEVFG